MIQVLDSQTNLNGGNPIISYSLEWDWGSNGAGYIPLTGSLSNNI